MINDKPTVADVHHVFNLAKIVFKYLKPETILLFLFVVLDEAILRELENSPDSLEGQQEYRDCFIYSLNKFASLLKEDQIDINVLMRYFL